MRAAQRVIPPEIAERIVDGLRDDRESLLACSLIARGWHTRALAHTFRVLEIVHGDPQSSWRWFTPDSKHTLGRGEREDAFIRVTPSQFLDELLVDYAHLVRFVRHLKISSGFGDVERDESSHASHRDMMSSPRFRLPDDHVVTRLTITGSTFALPNVQLVDPIRTAAVERHLFNFGKISKLDLSNIVFDTSNRFMPFFALFPHVNIIRITNWQIALQTTWSKIEPPFTDPRGCTLVLRPQTDSILAYSMLRSWVSLRPVAFSQIMVEGELSSRPQRRDWSFGLKTAMKATRHLYTILKLDLNWKNLDDATDLVALLPNLKKLCLRFEKSWQERRDLLLAESFRTTNFVPGRSSEISPPAPRRSLDMLVIVLEQESAYLLESHTDTWQGAADALLSPQWAGLKLCIVRLRATIGRIPAPYKQEMRHHLDSVCRGKKLRIYVDDTADQQEDPEEGDYEREFLM